MLKVKSAAFFAAVLLAVIPSNALAVTCTSLSSGNWNTASRWSCGHVPLAADAVVIGNGHAISVDTAAVGASLDISTGNTNSSVSINAGQSLTISGAVNISAAALDNNRSKALDVGAGTLNVGGNVTLTGGSGNRFADLTISTGTATIVGSITPSNANARVIFSGSGTLNIGGNFGNGGSFTAGTGAVVFNGAGAQSVASYSYNNLTVNKSAGTATLTGDTPIAGNLSVNAGTLDLSSFLANRATSGGVLTVANGATLKIGGSNTFPANYATHTLGASSTVDYSGAYQTVSAENYGHLSLSGSGTKTPAAGLTVNGNFTITGVTFSASSYTHNLKGNLSNAGTITPGTSTINFNGSGTQTISGATTFYNVAFANSGGTVDAGAYAHNVQGNFTNNGTFSANAGEIIFSGAAAQSLSGATTFNKLTMNNTSGGLTLSNDIAVNVELKLNSGQIITGSSKVSIGASAAVTNATSASYVYGNLEKNFPVATSFTFDIGDDTSYVPVLVNFISLTSGGSLLASTAADDHPQLAASAINPTKSVNRYWTLSSSAIAGAYEATFNFVAGDVDAGANTANFIIQRYASAAWSNTTLVAANPTSTMASGLSGFGDFAIGEPAVAGFLLERELIYSRELYY